MERSTWVGCLLVGAFWRFGFFGKEGGGGVGVWREGGEMGEGGREEGGLTCLRLGLGGRGHCSSWWWCGREEKGEE